MNRRIRTSAFSLVELIAITAVLLLAGFVILNFSPRLYNPKAKAPRIKCTNNLKNIGLAARIYATDNNDLMPGAYFLSNKIDLAKINAADYFRMLSNELSTPKIIKCPADKLRKEAISFTNLTTANISYFASLTVDEKLPQAFLSGDRNIQFINGQPIAGGLFTLTTNLQLGWSKDLHNGQGDIAMGDGSVQQFSAQRLNQGIRDQDVSTNHLIIP
jgi:prepilin-type processing-associated H-X9-DG protein